MSSANVNCPIHVQEDLPLVPVRSYGALPCLTTCAPAVKERKHLMNDICKRSAHPTARIKYIRLILDACTY